MPAAAVIGRVSVKVFPDTSDFRRDTQRKLTAIEKQLRFNIKADVDLTKATRDIKHWQNKNDPQKLSVKLDLNGVSTKTLATRLAFLTRPRDVSIRPNLDNTATAKVGAAIAALSGARALNSIFSDLFDTLKNLDKSVPKIAAVALAVAGLAAWGLTAAANLAALSASLASIAPAALALPGILAGIGVGLGITVLGLKDLQKALPDVAKQWQNVADQITRDFWSKATAGIRQLATVYLPHLADTAKQVGAFWGRLASELAKPFKSALGPMFANLNASIAIATKNSSVFANIITKLGLSGSQYLPRLAQWFVNISTTFSNWLNRVSADGSLKQWIDTGIEGLHQLGQIVKNIGGIFAGIGKAALKAGGSGLTPFAATLEKINKVVNSPGFQSTLVNVLGAAFTAMHNIAATAGPALSTLFSTLAHTLTTLFPLIGTTIGTVVNSIATVLFQPAVQRGLSDLFTGIATGIMSLAPAIKALAPLLGQIGSLIGTFARAFGPLLATALNLFSSALQQILPVLGPIVTMLSGALNQALKDITPAVTQVAKAFAGLLKTVAPVAAKFFGVIAKLFNKLAPIFDQLITALAPVIAQLGDLLANTIKGLTPAITALAKAFVKVVVPLAQALMPVLQQLLPVFVQIVNMFADAAAQILPMLADAIAQLLPSLTPVLSALLTLLVDILKPLLPALVQIAQQALPQLVPALTQLLVALVPLLQAFTRLINLLLPVLIPVIQLLAKIIVSALVGAINGVTVVIQGLTNILNGFMDFFSDLVHGRWLNALTDLGNIFKGAFQVIFGVVQVIWNVGVLGAFRKGFAVLKGLFSGFSGAAKGLWSGLMGGIKSLGESTFNGLMGIVRGAFGDIKSTVSGGISSVLGSLRSGLGKLAGIFTTAWKSAWRATWDGIQSIITTIGHLPGTILGILGNLGSLLFNAGKSLIGGFVSGIKSTFGTVKDTLTGLTKKLTSWKGPPKKDSVLLYKAGQLIIDGLIRGLSSRFDQVRSSLTTLTGLIGKVTSKSLQATLRDQAGRMNVLLGNYSSVTAALKAANDRLQQLAADALQYRDNIRNGITAAGNFTQFSGVKTFADLKQKLTDVVNQSWQFANLMIKLKKLGLNQTAIDQLAQAGISGGGLDAAKLIADAGKKGVQQLNKLDGDLANWAGKAANVATDAMYQNGLNMAKGLVKGLKDQQAEIQKTMTGIAKNMVYEIKTRLGIKSPSRVMATIGKHTGQGFLIGLESQYDKVFKSLKRFGAEVGSTAIGSPAMASLSGAMNAGSSSAGNRTLNYYAAPGNSLSSEEELFAASRRSRFAW